MKKIISAALAALLSISAFSAMAAADDTTIISEGVVARPAIKVTMPKSLSFVFNPYGLKVDAKGKIGEEIKSGLTGNAVLNTAKVVPSYIFDEATKDIGWIVTNNTGAPIKMGIVANSTQVDISKDFVVTDGGSDGIADAATYRSLKLTVTAAPIKANGSAYDTAKTVFVNTTAIEAESGKSILEKCDAAPEINVKGTLVDNIPAMTTATEPAAGTVAIKMTGAISNTGKLAWKETDIPKINFIFAFDLAGGATTA